MSKLIYKSEYVQYELTHKELLERIDGAGKWAEGWRINEIRFISDNDLNPRSDDAVIRLTLRRGEEK